MKRKPRRNENRNAHGIGDSKGERGLRNGELPSPPGPSSPPASLAANTAEKQRGRKLAVPCLRGPSATALAPVNTEEKPVVPEPRYIILTGTPASRPPALPNDGSLRVAGAPGETTQDVDARIAMHPAMQNAFLAKVFTEGKIDPERGNKLTGPLDMTACAEQMVQKLEAIDRGDLREAKQMLMAQATTLQAIFMEMGRRAALNMGTYIDPAETYLRLALKAQAQCRATVETLAEIVNPRPIFINPKQVNHAGGNQQVNNSEGPQQVNNQAPGPRVAENENPSNKVLENT